MINCNLYQKTLNKWFPPFPPLHTQHIVSQQQTLTNPRHHDKYINKRHAEHFNPLNQSLLFHSCLLTLLSTAKPGILLQALPRHSDPRPPSRNRSTLSSNKRTFRWRFSLETVWRQTIPPNERGIGGNTHRQDASPLVKTHKTIQINTGDGLKCVCFLNMFSKHTQGILI